MGSHFGVRIFPASREFGYKKYRTICDTKMRVKYMFYIHFSKGVGLF